MSARRAIVAALAGWACLGACTYERVVYRRPMLAGLEGTVSGGEVLSDRPRGYVDPTAVEDGRITVERTDGSKELISRTARHLMAHIYSTIEKEQRELFTEQVLSEETKEEFRARGLDPGAAFDELRARRGDISRLFQRMPMGERTPGGVLKKLGDRVYRVRVTGLAAEGLKFVGFDMVLEGAALEPIEPAEGASEAAAASEPTLEEAIEETGTVSGAVGLIQSARESRPEMRLKRSNWRLRWFVPGDE